jgi:hypothetical protein
MDYKITTKLPVVPQCGKVLTYEIPLLSLSKWLLWKFCHKKKESSLI